MTSLAQEDSTNLETPSDLIDAPRNIAARNRQEALWSETNVDARQQLHMREAALAYKSRFQLAMDWYDSIKFMVDCGEEYAFDKLHPGLIELIVQCHEVFGIESGNQLSSKRLFEQADGYTLATTAFMHPSALHVYCTVLGRVLTWNQIYLSI